MDRRRRLVIAVFALALYAASLLLPTATPFNPAYGQTTLPGYVTFRAWKGFFEWEPQDIEWWILTSAWLNNPLIWLSIVLAAANRFKASAIAAGCGLLLGLLVLPRFYLIIAGLPGYWAWIGSDIALLATGIYFAVKNRNRRRS